MLWSMERFIVILTVLVLSTSANAAVLNTLNGTNYEWLEFSESAGQTPDALNLRFTDQNDVLFGYEIASRELVERLMLSYSSWDGVSGNHSALNVLSGMNNFFLDFGITDSGTLTDVINLNTVDGGYVDYKSYRRSVVFFGTATECGGLDRTCMASLLIGSDENGVDTFASQFSNQAWESAFSDPMTTCSGCSTASTYVVKVSAVPVPTATWLFGSGLIGLIGMARRKA
jgi:hypothetical protein